MDALLRSFAESKGTGRQPPGQCLLAPGGGGALDMGGRDQLSKIRACSFLLGPLDFGELSMIPAQEGKYVSTQGDPHSDSEVVDGKRAKRRGSSHIDGSGVPSLQARALLPSPEPKRTRSKAFRLPGLGRKDRDRDSV